jgi:hypothetical protein
MRSCAFFIFEAATISIAFVILRVLCTLLIFVRISFEPAILLPTRTFPALCAAWTDRTESARRLPDS